ncbi:MAG: hypothetical protein M3R05_05025 [Chloroflexota bacterium]|nr:hypothetical protein [Chloroflexota bacterium]
MDPFSGDSLDGNPARSVHVQLFTAAYRVSGTTLTRFSRVTDIVNLQPTTHIVVEAATLTEFGDPAGSIPVPHVLVAIDEVLFLIVVETDADARPEMRIPKRPVRAQVALPPFRLLGTVHVAPGSRPADGLLNVSDRFVPMTDVSVSCTAHPEIRVNTPAVALQRTMAHVIVVEDDEQRDELLSDVLDERTAKAWLRPEPAVGSPR